MAIILTNGVCFISHNATGGVIKVSTIEQAQNFYTMEKAEKQINKVPGKCFGYYPVDTDVTPVHSMESEKQNTNRKMLKKSAAKRKIFSGMQRKEIYDRAEGCCQLCGRKITHNTMTIDHIIPFADGGSNELDNLQAVCKQCNQLKANIYPEQFLDRITEIFMYQMEKKYSDNLTWKISRNMLMEIL